MKTPDSLNSFMSILEDKHPQILPLITSKNEYFVELQMPHDDGKTFDQQSTFIKPILKPSVELAIKHTAVTFTEKQEYFKIVVNLR